MCRTYTCEGARSVDVSHKLGHFPKTPLVYGLKDTGYPPNRTRFGVRTCDLKYVVELRERFGGSTPGSER